MNTIRILAALLFLTIGSAQAATVSFDPLASSAGSGDTFFVDVTGSGFPTTEGGGVNLFYDASIVTVTSVSIDAGIWDFVNDFGTIDNGTGTVSDILVSAFPGVATGSFVVATIEFQAVGLGSSPLTITESALNPWASGGSAINPSFQAGSVTVSTVPLPGAVLFFMSGLLGLIGIAKKRKVT